MSYKIHTGYIFDKGMSEVCADILAASDLLYQFNESVLMHFWQRALEVNPAHISKKSADFSEWVHKNQDRLDSRIYLYPAGSKTYAIIDEGWWLASEIWEQFLPDIKPFPYWTDTDGAVGAVLKFTAAIKTPCLWMTTRE